MEMDVNVGVSQQNQEQKMDTSWDIFEGSDHDAGSLSSVDLFADSDDDVNDTKPIGDIPMEIDQPGPSNLRSAFDRVERESVPEELTPEITDCPLELGEPPAKIAYRTVEEERMAKTLARLRAESENGVRQFGRYMQLKKDKLRYQVNIISRVDNVVSSIFRGISIFVNGHTGCNSSSYHQAHRRNSFGMFSLQFLSTTLSYPSALELRELIQTHGGDYHCYMEYGHTTYTIASSLASAKVDKTRKNEIFLLPGWIIDCIAAGKLLPIDEYRLLPDQREKNAPITNFFARAGAETPVIQQREKALDARDPNFIQEFYARSRLHLISTLAQDMKDFMTMLRETGHFNNEEWDRVPQFPPGPMIDEPLIFHIDLDCFFVAVALRDRPELRDKPVAITHSRGSATAPGFSEVASVSYAARKLGMRNGMLVRDALKLCPALVCLPYQFDEYRVVSKSIYTLISKFTLEVRGVSCDEMYVNFSKSCREKRIADVRELANHIRKRIREETGCAASIGIGPNMLLARLATRKAKPDGVYWTRKNDAASFIANEKATVQKMQEKFGGELKTCGDLQNIDCQDLQAMFGKLGGLHIWQHCRGEDDSLKDFLTSAERKSVSCDINYGIRFTKREEVTDFLRRVVEEVCKKLNSCRRITGLVTLKLMVRSADAPVDTAKYLGHGKCDTTTKTTVLKGNTDCPRLLKEVLTLYDTIRPASEDLRGVGIHCGRLVPADVGVRRLQAMKNFFDPKPRAPARPKPPEPKKEKEETKVEDLIEAPKLNGLTVLSEIKTEIRGYLVEEPTEAHVRRLSRYLYQLKEYGAYSTIRELCIFLCRLQTDEDTVGDWPEYLDQIFKQLDTAIYWYWGGPFVVKELKTHPLTSCHKTCEHTAICECEY